jgi:hypothetical protein
LVQVDEPAKDQSPLGSGESNAIDPGTSASKCPVQLRTWVAVAPLAKVYSVKKLLIE